MLDRHRVLLFPLLFSVLLLFHLSNADLGTGASYGPPYLPTVCGGNDPNQFPAGNLFAAAGAGIWDNGASCGRQYLVRCLEGSTQDTVCSSSDTIQITIVDQATNLVSPPSRNGATMAFSVAAYGLIAKSSASNEINIEYIEISKVLDDIQGILQTNREGVIEDGDKNLTLCEVADEGTGMEDIFEEQSRFTAGGASTLKRGEGRRQASTDEIRFGNTLAGEGESTEFAQEVAAGDNDVELASDERLRVGSVDNSSKDMTPFEEQPMGWPQRTLRRPSKFDPYDMEWSE